MMIRRASLAPLTTGPPANTVSPADSALVVLLAPFFLTTVSLTTCQVQVVPSAALITTSLPLTDWMMPRSNESVWKPVLLWKVAVPSTPPRWRSRPIGVTDQPEFLNAVARPEVIYDFGGFDPTLQSPVGRVIARPFAGSPGAFQRTANRRDFTVAPTGETWLDRLVAGGRKVFGVGKIVDIFSGRGITSSVHTASDSEGVRISIDALRASDSDLVFTNLVDFDSKYGHRNDPAGFARNLAGLDALLPELLGALRPDDLFFLTADHGCETTDVSTDHTREHVPFLAAGAAPEPAPEPTPVAAAPVRDWPDGLRRPIARTRP